jgi:hypothetical protein
MVCADDCSFEHDGDESRAVRELHIECSDEALVAFHNEKGFQPKDLYAMCQVGESSKAAGSGKIGRKGIGFKSVFRVTHTPQVHLLGYHIGFERRIGDVGSAAAT